MSRTQDLRDIAYVLDDIADSLAGGEDANLAGRLQATAYELLAIADRIDNTADQASR